jgi:hypothetical protein
MQTTTSNSTTTTDFIFLQRIFNYGPVTYYINWVGEFYSSLKKRYPAIKFGLDKAEQLFEFLQPYITDLQKNKVITKVDEFTCRQLDTLEFGFERTKELLDQDVVASVKSASVSLAENGKQLVQEKVVKPVGGPVREYIDTQVEMLTEKFNAPEVQEKIAPIQEFVLEKAQYVHEQIENNSRFEAIRPHYENALAQVTQVVENLSNNQQQEKDQQTQPGTEENNDEVSSENQNNKPREFQAVQESSDEINPSNDDSVNIKDDKYVFTRQFYTIHNLKLQGLSSALM